MIDHPDRAPRSGFDAAVRLAATTVAMTVAALVGCAILAGLVLATSNPEALATGAIIAVLAAAGVANLLAKLLRP
jgi:hypothetical protein